MPRKDDFGDLPSLMPDSDEIKRTAQQSLAATQDEALDNVDGPSSRQPPRPLSASRGLQNSPPQVVIKSSGLIWFLVLAMGVSLVGGGYWAYNKLTDVDLMMTVSRGELNHARKRIGELEALVVATDVNSNKSGTVVQTQVRLIDDRVKERNRFVDTEIDKLWGVAYRTNRPAIEESQKAIDNNTATIKQQGDTLQAQNQLVEQQQNLVSSQQMQLEQTNKVSQLAVQDVADQLHKITLLQSKVSKLLERVASHEKALSDQNKTGVAHAQLAQQQAQAVVVLELQVQQQAQAVVVLELQVQQQAQAVVVLELQVQQQAEAVAVLELQVQQQVQQQSLTETARQSENDIKATRATDMELRLSQLESSSRIVSALEQNASQMDERVFNVEQSLDAVNAFRQDTSRSINQLRTQVRNLSYSE
jgi:hypothetical protein